MSGIPSPSQGNIFLTTENLAFSLPLIIVCGTYAYFTLIPLQYGIPALAAVALGFVIRWQLQVQRDAKLQNMNERELQDLALELENNDHDDDNEYDDNDDENDFAAKSKPFPNKKKNHPRVTAAEKKKKKAATVAAASSSSSSRQSNNNNKGKNAPSTMDAKDNEGEDDDEDAADYTTFVAKGVRGGRKKKN